MPLLIQSKNYAGYYGKAISLYYIIIFDSNLSGKNITIIISLLGSMKLCLIYKEISQL